MTKTKSNSVPKVMKERFSDITKMTDALCKKYLDDDYKKLVRKAVTTLCRKRPSC